MPNAYTSLSLESPDTPTIKSNGRETKLARQKKTLHLPASFDVQVEEWQQFIGSIPGREYDGVDIAANDEGDIEIVAGWGKLPDGTRKQFTASDKADMQAYAASLAGDVVSMSKATG